MKFSCYRNSGKMFCQNSPYLHDKIFTTRHFIAHKVNIEIEIFMIEFIHDFPPDHCTEFFKVNHKACIGVRLTFYRDNQLEIVAVPVFIRAGPEHSGVLFLTPRRIVKFMGCVEVFFSGYVEHWQVKDL